MCGHVAALQKWLHSSLTTKTQKNKHKTGLVSSSFFFSA